MSATITIDGHRVYISTRYGDPCVAALKRLGAHWDASTKRWWIAASKRAAVESAVAATAGQQATESDDPMVIGKAKYKGRAYYIRWIGQCKTGQYKARLCSLDGKIDFWAPAARASYEATGDGAIAVATKMYDRPAPLSGLRRCVSRLRARDQELGSGCAECQAAGVMCRSCRHDIYDY